MSENVIKGFPAPDGVAQYDFGSLANVPEPLQEMPAAKVGQYLVVAEVGEDGRIRKAKATDFIGKRIIEITLIAANWQTVEEEQYIQGFDIPTVTPTTEVTHAIDDATIKILQEKMLTLSTKNVGGKVVVTATGVRPTRDYTIQIKLEEVTWL